MQFLLKREKYNLFLFQLHIQLQDTARILRERRLHTTAGLLLKYCRGGDYLEFSDQFGKHIRQVSGDEKFQHLLMGASTIATTYILSQ